METIKFTTTLSSFGNNTGIEVPEEVMKKLNAGKRPSLMINVNGYEYQNTPGVMNGKTFISFSSENRINSGLKGGDAITVELMVATTAKKVEMSKDFFKALQETKTEDFFNALPNSLQRYHCDLINSAKTEETKLKRIEKATILFSQGKKR